MYSFVNLFSWEIPGNILEIAGNSPGNIGAISRFGSGAAACLGRKEESFTITARINGQEEIFSSSLSVSAFLEEKGYRSARVAVEKNGAIVPKREHESCLIDDGDTLEVVSFVGGG